MVAGDGARIYSRGAAAERAKGASMFSGNVDNLVLATVNAPWKDAVSAGTLADRIARTDIESALPHIVTFYTEIAPDLVLAFAEQHRIPSAALVATYRALRAATGERNETLESALGELAAPA
jgi:hypothetical protein